MAEDHPDVLERFPPVMLHSILAAVRRFEPDLYTHICRSYHLNADTILGLFGEVDMLGPGQLVPVLRDLREHQSYGEIMDLAGRNAFTEYAGLLNYRPASGSDSRLRSSVQELLPVFAGNATFVLMQRGNVMFMEMWDSLFARNLKDIRPLCSFYCGLVSELAATATKAPWTVTESRCCAVDPDIDSCQFQISVS